jgi:hypothetical protein
MRFNVIITLIGLLALSVPSLCAQEPNTPIALINTNIPTGPVLRDINRHCRNVVLILDQSRAAYQLEVQVLKVSENVTHSWLTLFNKQGEAIFVTDTSVTGNAVKDVCEFLKLGKP